MRSDPPMKAAWRVVAEVIAERKRQEILVSEGRFPATCASDLLSPMMKLAVLTEELGEVAQELVDDVNGTRFAEPDRLRTELIQVAAVAVAWAESLTDEGGVTG